MSATAKPPPRPADVPGQLPLWPGTPLPAIDPPKSERKRYAKDRTDRESKERR